MNKHIAMILCCILVLLCGCELKREQYKRISFESETLDDSIECIKENTIVVNKASVSFPSQVPIYRIEERIISENECLLMIERLGLPANSYHFEHKGNKIHINLVSYTDFDRGFYNMTDEEAEEQAWKLFNKIPFIEGEYECIGIRESTTLDDKNGTHITRAGVSFCRLLDGVRVTGDESCTLYFDGSGLVEVSINLYSYEKAGTMEMVPLSDAEAKLKTPDDFDILSGQSRPIETLQVDQVYLRMVNQHSKGCSILQPIYFFKGTATLEDASKAEFSSKVIAIPETMTYVEE